MTSVRKRTWKTDKSEPRVAWTVDIVDVGEHRDRRQFTTKAAADAFRIRAEGQKQHGTYRQDAARLTVGDVANAFLEHCEGRMSRGERMTRHNYKTYEGHVRNYICPDANRPRPNGRDPRLQTISAGLGHIKLVQVSAGAVGDFRDRLRDAGVTVPTTRKILGTLQQLLNYAVARDHIAVNPARGIKVIGTRAEASRKIVPPTKDDMKRLIAVADREFALKLIFASTTGVRAGELHALRWQHINWRAGEVTIETRVDAYHEEDVTKTEAGMRTIPLASKVLEMLREWRGRSTLNERDDLVFPSRGGWYVGHDNMVKRKFRPLFDRLSKLHVSEPSKHPKPPKPFNWHALRHFAISSWIDAGLAPKTVQTFAGHSGLQVTMDRYGHLFRSDDHKDAMETIASGIIP